MIIFEPNQTTVLLGSGDVYICHVEDEDGRFYLIMKQTEPGPLGQGIQEVLEGDPIPKNSVLIESTSLQSLEIVIEELQLLCESMRRGYVY